MHKTAGILLLIAAASAGITVAAASQSKGANIVERRSLPPATIRGTQPAFVDVAGAKVTRVMLCTFASVCSTTYAFTANARFTVDGGGGACNNELADVLTRTGGNAVGISIPTTQPIVALKGDAITLEANNGACSRVVVSIYQ